MPDGGSHSGDAPAAPWDVQGRWRRAAALIACIASGSAFRLIACGAGSASAPAVAPAASSPAPSSQAERKDPLPTVSELVGRGPQVAAGLREILHGEVDSPGTVPVQAADADVCLRVVFASLKPVHAALRSSAGDVLSEGGASVSGLLGAHGPVCARHGQAMTLVFDGGTGAHVRYVVWASP